MLKLNLQLFGGRGSSTTARGAGNGNGQSNSGWKQDYNKAVSESERYRKQADSMNADVKAAKDAYNKAPTRTKAQKEESERLERKASELSHERDVLLYRAAQFATIAENIRMENDKRYRNRKNRQAIANARRNYR